MRVPGTNRVARAAARGLILALLAASVVWGQSLQQAEELWKQHELLKANDIFRDLVDKYPDNAEYRVLWGRLFLEHAKADDIQTASDLFNEALKIKKDYAPALVGLAWIEAANFGSTAGPLAKKALQSDPQCVEAYELLARLALEDNNNAGAEELAKKALAIDANSVQAKAVLATMDWLADKKETPWDPHAAKGYETAGHFFMLNRRYEESIEYYRKAIALDPKLWSARSQLAINLMRLSQNEEAYQQLDLCWNNGFQDLATKNTIRLMDSYPRFTTFKTDKTVLVVNKKEADLLHPYIEGEMQRAIATYEKKYKLKLDMPVRVEVYPDHEDFAVRTLGMPGLGALGVTFVGKTLGYDIAMDSPSGRPPGQFHWASTLWHEMSHVFTLSMTNSHVPRWFTEGLAVHEETAASPEWGDRLGPEEISAIKNKQLLPIADLDRGFVHPTAPAQVIVSYFQAGRICDYINNKWGWDTLLNMLHDFAVNVETADVIRKELKIEPQAFDKEFLAWVEADTKKQVQNFDEWRSETKVLVEAAKKKDNDTVIKMGPGVRDLYPDFVEAGNAYEMVANAYIAKGDKPAAIQELLRYVHAGGRNPDSIMLLGKMLVEANRKKEAADVLEGLNDIFPEADGLHKQLGTLLFDAGNGAGAVREFRSAVASNPVDAAQAHYDLARAYHLNHQDEQAKDELLAALEVAPGFRPAQKLLLELSGGG
jgi:tetratricopeptide (TPR) repeat protein